MAKNQNLVTAAVTAAIALLGSGTLPAEIEITADKKVQLGDVVAAAQARSGLSAEDWNKLTDEERDVKLNEEIDLLKKAEVDAAEAAAKNASEKTDAASKVKQVEASLLRDSQLGQAGDVVKVDERDVEAFKLHGMIDTAPAAVKYAKSQLKKKAEG